MKQHARLSVRIACGVAFCLIAAVGAASSSRATVRTDVAAGRVVESTLEATLLADLSSANWSLLDSDMAVTQELALLRGMARSVTPKLALGIRGAPSDLLNTKVWQPTTFSNLKVLTVPPSNLVSPRNRFTFSWLPLAAEPDTASTETTRGLLAQNLPSNQGPTAPTEAQREADLARKLANPISSLISVPFQSNFNFGIGPTQNGFQYLLNVQPVVPFSLTENWNLIARMIMPVIYQNDIFPGAGDQFGLGDTTFQMFFSPKAATKGGVIWGVGPLFFVPSGAYLLSTSTWGAGVDAVALKQVPQRWMNGGILTYGMLASQTWPVSGAAPINSLFLQPFVAYTLKNSVTFNLQSQSTYNWTQSQWTVPLIASVSKIYKFGSQLTSIGVGAKYYPVSPTGQPTWGLQLTITLLFPTKQ